MSFEQDFKLHPQLQADSVFICELALCQVRMINDANYPWFLLIPKQKDVSEPYQLSPTQQQMLTKESRILSLAIEKCFSPDKLNIASIGNMVPQLHVHHIARFKSDLAWPKPVWGVGSMVAFDESEREKRVNLMTSEIEIQKTKI